MFKDKLLNCDELWGEIETNLDSETKQRIDDGLKAYLEMHADKIVEGGLVHCVSCIYGWRPYG